MIEIRIIDIPNKADINIPNESFPLYGKIIPSLCDGVWSYRIVLFTSENISEMTFPDENYSFDVMSADFIFVGAYDEEKCVGLAVWQKKKYRYLYLYDLKVNRDYRGKGIALELIKHGKRLANELGYRGIYTIGQDNNLNACKFYIKSGFEIGGFNDHVYNGTEQEGIGDIYFYSERD